MSLRFTRIDGESWKPSRCADPLSDTSVITRLSSVLPSSTFLSRWQYFGVKSWAEYRRGNHQLSYNLASPIHSVFFALSPEYHSRRSFLLGWAYFKNRVLRGYQNDGQVNLRKNNRKSITYNSMIKLFQKKKLCKFCGTKWVFLNDKEYLTNLSLIL